MKGFIYFSIILLMITGCGGDKTNSPSDAGETNNSAVTNNAPRILTEPAIQILEGEQIIASLKAEDKENDPLEFTLESGPDKERFTLDAQGHLAFKDLPDYEAPMDVNGDNLYEVKVAVSDGNLSDNLDLKIQVTNALEGRVVDGPLAEAQVFIDCNGDGVKNADELSTTTDENGYYIAALPKNCDNRVVISKGGRDIATGKETAMVLMARIPDNYDMSKNVVVTPISTVLAYSNQENQKSILKNIGINSIETIAQLLSLDPWQVVTTSKVNSKATETVVDLVEVQKVNVQLATLIETVDTLNEDDQNTNVALAVADLIRQEGKPISLNNTVTLATILDAAVDANVSNAILEIVATINTYLAVQFDPASNESIQMMSNSQDDFQENVTKLMQKQLTEEEFRQNTSSDLTTIISAPIATTGSVEVPEKNQVSIILKGNNSDGSVAKELLIEDIPSHGSLKDSSGHVINIQDLPYKLPSNQLLYTSKSSVSNDSFIFTVVDGVLKSAPATVAIKITGINDRPLANDAVITFKEGESRSILLEGSDEDGDSLNYKIVSLPKFGKLMDGDKELKLIDLSYQLSEGKNLITYVSSETNVNTDVFYFVSNDGQVNSKRAKVSLNIKGANQIPIIEGQQALSTPEDNSLEITLAHLTVSDGDNKYPNDFTLQISDGTNYSVDGTTISPKANFVGSISVPISVNDGTHSSELYELTVEVLAQNDAPILFPIDPINFDEDGQKVLIVQGFDIDGDDLTFSITVDPEDKVKVEKVTSLAKGYLSTQERYKFYAVDHYHNDSGVQFTATVTDDKGLSDSKSFTVTVNAINDAPKIKLKNVGVATEQKDYTYQVDFEDPDDVNNGTDLTWTLSNAPDGMIITPTGVIKWNPDEGVSTSGPVTLTLSDGGEDGAAAAEQIIIVQVIQKDDPGTVFIHGKPLIGQTLTASVSDPDNGNENVSISYQWQRSNSDITSSADYYLLTDADIGETITVTASYTDKQGFEEDNLTATTDAVVAMPISKKTIMIESASAGMTVFDFNENSTFSIGNLSSYTLKELSPDRLMEIVENSLPEQAPAEGLDNDNSDSHGIYYGYQHIQGLYDDLDDSSLFEIDQNGQIILTSVPELPESYVGTGEEKIRIGVSHTLALFDNSTMPKLQRLINIRFSPSSISTNICSNQVGDGQSQLPVVLVHGWMGFDRASLIDVSHWYQIEPKLAETGAQVFAARLDYWALAETRGEQLIAYIECVLDKTGKSRVDLIGHSLGSPTARYASYWLDEHSGHAPVGGSVSEIRSVTAVSGTHYGGNLILADQQHLARAVDKANTLYKTSTFLIDFSPTDLLFSVIDRGDLSDSNTYLGKQYSLAINILNELVNEGGMLDNVHETLSASQGIMNSLIGNDQAVITEWRKVEGTVKDWVWLASNLFWGRCYDGRVLNCNKWLDDFFVEIVDGLFLAFEGLDAAAGQMNVKIGEIKTEIPKLKLALNSIKEEFEKLPSQTYNPDYTSLVQSLEKVQKVASSVVGTLPELKTHLNSFKNNMDDLSSALFHYDRFMERAIPDGAPFLELVELAFDLGIEFSAELVLGLNRDEVQRLRYVVDVFIDILEHDLIPLLKNSSDINVADLIRGLSMVAEDDRKPTVGQIADLIEDAVYLLDSFQGAVNRNKEILNNLNPKWLLSFQDIYTPLSPVSGALTNTGDKMKKIDLSIDNIQSAIRLAVGEYNANWQRLLELEFNQVHGLKAQLIYDFLATDAAANKYKISLDNVKDCLLENQQLNQYILNQVTRKNNDANYAIELPTSSELSSAETDCATVINNIIDALVDHIIPMDEVNPRTGKIRSEDVEEIFYTVSGFASQLFNLKYPDTGITPGRHKSCMENRGNSGFSSTADYNAGRSTKYYSIVSNRHRDPDNFTDRAMANTFVSLNNPAREDTASKVTDLAAIALLTNRKDKRELEGDMTSDEIAALFNRSDVAVATCSHELGEVFEYKDSYVQDLSHVQVINQSLYSPAIEDLIKLTGGQDASGYASISGELDRCNNGGLDDGSVGTIEDRKNCLRDLFPRLLIMYATGKAIDGITDQDNNSSLDIFDLLRKFVKRNGDLTPIEHFDVPELYKAQLRYVQQQG